jgi:2-keto-4-pentenoate hydratase/2-oxohepta-3-ene-1,7-dioic acid hydratase in catechol pathway
MRLITFQLSTPIGRLQRLGALLKQGDVLDLNFAYTKTLELQQEPEAIALAAQLLPSTMRDFLKVGPSAMARAKEMVEHYQNGLAATSPLTDNGAHVIHRLGDVTVLAPVPEPTSLRDFYGFEVHVRTGFAKRGETIPPAWYEMPVYYKGNPHTILGPDTVTPWPHYTDIMDFELELACVIGKGGKDIPVDKAHEHIAGFMIMNDLSARDIQKKEMSVRLGPAKGKDFATVLGPYLVTLDELNDLRDLPMSVKVNGEVWSSGNAGSSHWTFPQMIAHASMSEPLLPGDVFGSGTVGLGCGLELDRYLNAGDVVELEIGGLGILRNTIGQKQIKV